MKKIEIPIDQIDSNLYYDLVQTGLAKIKNKGTDRETLVFTVFDTYTDTSKVMHKNVLEHNNQSSIYDAL